MKLNFVRLFWIGVSLYLVGTGIIITVGIYLISLDEPETQEIEVVEIIVEDTVVEKVVEPVVEEKPKVTPAQPKIIPQPTVKPIVTQPEVDTIQVIEQIVEVTDTTKKVD
jgi:hypothetical protein